MTSEKLVQNKILKYLKKLEKEGKPLLYHRRDAIGFNYEKGSADLWIVYKGIHIEVEIKAPDKKQKNMQKKWQEKCIKCNIIYIVVNSFLDFKNYMENIIKLF